LTSYLLQTLIALLLFYGFMPGPHLMNKVGAIWLLPLSVLNWAMEAWFAHFWLQHFRYGPVEWLWRCLTYWKIQPFERIEPVRT
jgi:uncharacterized protein